MQTTELISNSKLDLLRREAWGKCVKAAKSLGRKYEDPHDLWDDAKNGEFINDEDPDTDVKLHHVMAFKEAFANLRAAEAEQLTSALAGNW